jgi:2-amino-4-hydroxy-6-hydroxymethyldihydropteridine diphosphokinase
MGPPHKYYLSLGSNIQPETNLALAIEHLGAYGLVESASSIWESRAMGAVGPNFRNACISFRVPVGPAELKRNITSPIEQKMGRVRTRNRSAPRTIDIDILMEDDQPLNLQLWKHPFVVLPMADLLPHLSHPTEHRPLADVAQEIRQRTWIVPRPEKLLQAAPPSSREV